MLASISQKFTYIFIKYGVVDEKKKEIYIYGLELLFSTMFTMLSILALSFVALSPAYGFVFLLFFIPVRLFAGGFHAKTFAHCFFITNGIFLTVFLCARIMEHNIIINGILYLASACYIWIKAPVIHKNQIVKQEKVEKNRRMSKKIIMIETILVLVSYLLQDLSGVTAMAVYATCSVALMMILCRKEG